MAIPRSAHRPVPRDVLLSTRPRHGADARLSLNCRRSRRSRTP